MTAIPKPPLTSPVVQEVRAGVERRVADVIVETLQELGVDTFYGVPGGAICQIYDALLDAKGARVINTRHESGAAFMAMGHAKAGGSLPALLMTSGPGITNALTGLAAAHADGVPMIAIGGEVPKKNYGRGALQEGSRHHLDILGMVRSVTKFAAEITNPRAAAAIVRKAVATARSGRQGPVFLSLPLDVAGERVLPMRASSSVATQFEVDQETLAQAAAALQTSERGLILCGSGARHPEAVRWIGTLASSLGVPVATTPRGKGIFPESDPLSLGVFGFGGHASATKYLEGGIDTLLCIGCGLGETGTNSWSPLLQPSKTFIQIDIDAAQIGKNYQVDIGLVGPSHTVLRELVSRVERRPEATPSGSKRLEHIETKEQLATDGLLKPAPILRAIQAVMPRNTIFTSDIGEHTIFALHYLQIDHADGFQVATGLGSMGSGIGAAIGAKVAKPDRPVVAICGDWGFQMSGMELATCVQEGLDVVFAIFNDARMRMVESGQTRVFGRPGKMDAQRVDFAEIARAVGAHGVNVHTLDELGLGLKSRIPGVPLVLDVEIDPTSTFPANGRVAQIRNFSAS